MPNRLRRFSALSPQARALFMRAAVLLPLIAVSLKLRGFRKTQQILQPHSSTVTPNGSVRGHAAAGDYAALCVSMVSAVTRHLWPRATCLEKSLTLCCLLSRAGVAADLRIGATTAAGHFEAHAWVELAGAALNEPNDLHRHYATFDSAFPLRAPELP